MCLSIVVCVPRNALAGGPLPRLLAQARCCGASGGGEGPGGWAGPASGRASHPGSGPRRAWALAVTRGLQPEEQPGT
jgi:hypothetical protein